jgi:hypothetical protein
MARADRPSRAIGRHTELRKQRFYTRMQRFAGPVATGSLPLAQDHA